MLAVVRRIRLLTLCAACLLIITLTMFVAASPALAADAGTPAEPTGIDLAGPPVELDHAPELGEFDTTDAADRTVVVPAPVAQPQEAQAPASGEPVTPTTASTQAGANPVVSGTLPFTGASISVIALLGLAGVVLGATSIALARRLDATSIGS